MKEHGHSRPRPLQPLHAPDLGGDRSGGNKERDAWAAIAKNYTVDNKLHAWGIPESNWQHPTIRTFVTASINAENLQGDLTVLSSQTSILRQLDYVKYGQSEEGNVFPDLAGMPATNLSQRTQDAELLMRVVKNILEDGFWESSVSPSYIREKTDVGIAHLGLRAVKTTEETETEQEIKDIPNTVNSLWNYPKNLQEADKMYVYYQYQNRYGKRNQNLWHYPQEKSLTSEQTLTLEKTAERLGIGKESLENPFGRKFLETVTNARTLLETFQSGEEIPTPGLSPTVAERYQQCAPIMQVVVDIMEEGFQGKVLDTDKIKERLNTALNPVGVAIVDNNEDRRRRKAQYN